MKSGSELLAGVPRILAMKSASKGMPRPASRRRAASTKTHSVSISVPSRSKTTARTGRRSLLGGAVVIWVGIGKCVVPNGLQGDLSGAIVGPPGLGVHHVCEFRRGQLLRAFVRHDRRFARPDVDPEFQAGDAQLLVRQQGRPADALAIDAGAVCAAQIADQQNAVGFHQYAVLFRDALMVEPQVAILLPADEDQVLRQLQRRTAVEGDELRAHRGTRPERSWRGSLCTIDAAI